MLDFTVLLSADHATWLRQLAQTHELTWATTWEHHPNAYIAPLLELPALPVVELTGYRRRPDAPRLAGADALLGRKWAPLLRHAAGRPFAWMDVVIPERLLAGARHRSDRVLLPVDPGRGLRRAHVEKLLDEPPRADDHLDQT